MIFYQSRLPTLENYGIAIMKLMDKPQVVSKMTKFKNKITKTVKTWIMHGKYNRRNFKSMPFTSMVCHFLSFKIKAFIFEQNISKLAPCGIPAAALKLLLLLSPLKLYTTVTTYSSSIRAVGKFENLEEEGRGGYQ